MIVCCGAARRCATGQGRAQRLQSPQSEAQLKSLVILKPGIGNHEIGQNHPARFFRTSY
jgi:hypothetical protein